MLKNIHLKNIALIEEADIDLGSGLNIITGETGSGKSVIIGAVNIALGGKASRSIIRRGADYALAELLFTNAPPDALSVLDSLGIERDGRNISITRKITRDSSSARVNGELVTLNSLKKITSLLADVHGQHEHQSLLSPAKHMEIVDGFGGDAVLNEKHLLADELFHYRQLRKEYSAYDMDAEELEREVSLIEYECTEIEAAALTPGEDTRLENDYRKMLKLRKTIGSVKKTAEIFTAESGVTALASDALKEMDLACSADSSLSGFRSALTDIESLSKDLSAELERYIAANADDGQKFKETEERLNLINHLKSRYGKSIEEIIEYDERNRSRLEFLKGGEETKKSLAVELSESRNKINIIAGELSSARKKAAAVLEPLIKENLRDLNFLNTDFKISFSLAEKISANGFDRIEFLISANPGEPLKPLAEVASGGELSRVMLALKSAAAENDSIPTLLFDEIDSGISGLTAQRVSEKLVALSREHQIICITHLPQIASMADEHFLIQKETNSGGTISGVTELTENGSVKALAAMLSGAEITESSLANARELKAGADMFKRRKNGV